MWPEAGSGFEPTSFSPAAGLERDATIASNVGRDPKGVWKALRGSWGLWILIGGIGLFVLAAVISTVLS
jgi:hypothetical protein